MLPLVACIMPTANRREHVRRAIDLFLAQDYPRKQLFVVEDGGEKNVDVARGAGVVYVYLGDEHRSVGEKRNYACAMLAKIPTLDDALIAHWDDDDWSLPQRLSTQVETMTKAKARLCGMDRLVFIDETAAPPRAYIHEHRPTRARPIWLAGGTLIYERSLWEELGGFKHVLNGEDTQFVDEAVRRDVRCAVVGDLSLYVAKIHGSNTVDYKSVVDRWSPFSVETVKSWMAS